MQDRFTTPTLLIVLALALLLSLLVWWFTQPSDKTDEQRQTRHGKVGKGILFAVLVTVATLALQGGSPKPGVYWAGGEGSGKRGVVVLRPINAGLSYLDAAPVGKGRISWASSFGSIQIQFEGETSIVPLPYWNNQILIGGVVYRLSSKPPVAENFDTEIGYR